MSSNKNKLRAISMAHAILNDKRSVSRYGHTTITSKTDPSIMFTYSDMMSVLEEMYDELEGDDAD